MGPEATTFTGCWLPASLQLEVLLGQSQIPNGRFCVVVFMIAT